MQVVKGSSSSFHPCGASLWGEFGGSVERFVGTERSDGYKNLGVCLTLLEVGRRGRNWSDPGKSSSPFTRRRAMTNGRAGNGNAAVIIDRLLTSIQNEQVMKANEETVARRFRAAPRDPLSPPPRPSWTDDGVDFYSALA